MDIKTVVKITAKAWSLPILSQLHVGVAGRQAPLLAATGAGRTAFAQSMDHLIEIGLLERNPGHGHPLRPEFRLTPSGVAAAKIAHQVLLISPTDGQGLLRRAWTVPVLTSMHRFRHFGEIKRSLPKITDRALSHSLKSLETVRWIKRDVLEDFRPPKTQYRPIMMGLEISQITGPSVTFG